MWEGLWGNFAVSGETFFYMEYNYKLFRWNLGETEWFYTGVEETIELSDDNVGRGFKTCGIRAKLSMSVSGMDISCNRWMAEIVGTTGQQTCPSQLSTSIKLFLQMRQCMSQPNKGVFTSIEGVVWNAFTDKAGASVIIKALATAEDAVYGANDDGIYHLEKETGTWEQIVPEIS